MKKAEVMLMVAVAFWGMTIAPTKWALESIPPLTLIFLRLFLGSLLFLPFAWKVAGGLQWADVPWKRLASLSFTGVAGYFLLQYVGVSMTSGVHASIISASLPLCTIVLAAVYLKEQITRNQWLGLWLGVAGVLAITVHPGSGDTQGSFLMGDLLVLAAHVIWALYVIQLKRPQGEERLPSEMFTALTLVIGGLMVLPFAGAELWYLGMPEVTAKGFWSLVALVLGPTILAYWLWNRGIESVSAGKAGLYLNTMPLISVITSILLLGEALTWRTLIGGLLVIAGVFWAEKKSRLPSAASQA